MKKIIINLLIIIFILITQPVFSEEETQDSIFIINSYNFIVDGYTRPFALANKAEIIEGTQIIGFVNLENYIHEKTQILYNERVLDSVRIEYVIGDVNEAGKHPVDLSIYVKDTWNIVAIPRPEYSTNTGFDITVKARDYNFLGTMSPLRIDLGYNHDEEGRNFFTFMIDSNIPIRLFDLNWYVNFDHDFSYRPDMDINWYYKNSTGLSVDIPIGFTTPNFGFDILFIANEANSDINRELYDLGESQEGLYISTRPYLSWEISILEIENYGELNYTPRLSATFNHEIAPWELSINRKGTFLGFSHSLDFGRVNWIDNFQQGYKASLGNSFNYSFFRLEHGDEPLHTDLNATLIAHFIFLKHFGLSSRFVYHQRFNNDFDEAGDVLRGVLDKDITTNFLITLNFDLPIRAIRARPSEWFKLKTRLFDFDINVGPIFDIAYTNDKIYYSGGAELVLFPIFFRSLYLRFSTAWDFSNLAEGTPMELFIGTELHY